MSHEGKSFFILKLRANKIMRNNRTFLHNLPSFHSLSKSFVLLGKLWYEIGSGISLISFIQGRNTNWNFRSHWKRLYEQKTIRFSVWSLTRELTFHLNALEINSSVDEQMEEINCLLRERSFREHEKFQQITDSISVFKRDWFEFCGMRFSSWKWKTSSRGLNFLSWFVIKIIFFFFIFILS